MLGNTIRDPRQLTLFCALGALGLGLAYLAMACALVRYLGINVAALAIGLCLVKIVHTACLGEKANGFVSLAIGTALLATALAGTSVNGATRWISLAGLAIQPSLILLPLSSLLFARRPTSFGLAGFVLASSALALQPDRAMAGALAAGMLALCLMRPEPRTVAASLASCAGFVATLVRPDRQGAMPFVDQILYSAFEVHPLAGAAVVGGSALLLLPAVVSFLQGAADRHVHAVLGATWLVIIVAAAVGNFPTPVVGYGGSAIIGYLLCMLGLERPAAAHSASKEQAGRAPVPEGSNHTGGLPRYRSA